VAGVTGVTAVAAVQEAFVATFSANTDADIVAFDGVSQTLTASQTATQNAAAYAAAYTAAGSGTNFTAVASGATVTFTQKTGSNIADKTTSDFVVTSGGGGTDATVTAAAPTTQGVTAVTGVTAVIAVAAKPALSGADSGNVYAYSGGAEGGTSGYVIKDTTGTTPAFYKATIAADGGVIRGDALTTSQATTDPLEKLDAALKTVDDLRGSLGATQNRFASVIANLGTTIVNLSASRSRIEDADYATEVSNMTRAQILQQAGTSVLAKANQSTEGVMSLLR
jgi:flagellin